MCGFTVIELLVVITILLVVLSVAIPQLRVINQERKIREASRVVTSVFERAARLARQDGSAAVILVRNNKFSRQYPSGFGGLAGDDVDVAYGVNQMLIATAVPDFRGDSPSQNTLRVYSDDDTMNPISDSNVPADTIVIGRPFAHNAASNRYVVEKYDRVDVNGVEYVITDVTEYVPATAYTEYPNGMLILTTTPAFPEYVASTGGPIDSIGPYQEYADYVIKRRPRLNNVNEVNMPRGFMVDLRYTGEVTTLSAFAETFETTFSTTDDDFVRYDFNSDGIITSIQVGDGIDRNTATTPQPITEIADNYGSLFLLVADDGLELDAAADQLTVPTNNWVVVSVFGRVSVSPVVAQANPVSSTDRTEFNTRLWNSRSLARTALQAAQ